MRLENGLGLPPVAVAAVAAVAAVVAQFAMKIGQFCGAAGQGLEKSFSHLLLLLLLLWMLQRVSSASSIAREGVFLTVCGMQPGFGKSWASKASKP